MKTATDTEADGLDFLINHSVDNDPDFADVWSPYAHMIKLADERIRLGLSQADVAEEMGIGRSAVARMENDPSGVAFSRILAYAKVLGVELISKPSKRKPKLRATRPGRPIAPKRDRVDAA